MSDKTVTKINEPDVFPTPRKIYVSNEQLGRDYRYFLAQKMLTVLKNNGLISDDEYDKITAKNRQSFSPYLAEIMD